jgi:hypothetical protein
MAIQQARLVGLMRARPLGFCLATEASMGSMERWKRPEAEYAGLSLGELCDADNTRTGIFISL